GTRNYKHTGASAMFFLWVPMRPLWLGFLYSLERNSRIVVESPVPPLALLIFRNALQQMHASEIRPQRCSHINLCVSQLPKQEVAEPHLPRGSDDQVRIGQVARVEMPRNHVLIDAQMIEPTILRSRVQHRAEGVH